MPYAMTVVGALLVVALMVARPSSNPHDWARDEAEERMRRRDAGLPVVFGVNYAAIRFMRDIGALKPEAADALEAGDVPPVAREPLRSSHTV
jgi:hypothetical protein